jgi:hypothetical protein
VKLLEDLKLKFPLKEVALYGFCIVVPGPEFDPDWEAELGDHGYKCFGTFLDGKPVTLVRVAKTEKGSGEKTVYSPPPAAKASAEGEKETLIPRASPSSKWRPEEDEVLVKLWNERVLIEKMTPSFPGRTEAAIRLRIQRLERYGRIKKRAGRPKGLKSSVRRWSDQEEQMLVELWNKDVKVPGMLAQFPGRTRNSVAMHIDILQKAGTIKPRWKAGEGNRRKLEESKAGKAPIVAVENTSVNQTQQETPVAPAGPSRRPFQIQTTITIDVHVDCGNATSVENLLRILKEVSV